MGKDISVKDETGQLVVYNLVLWPPLQNHHSFQKPMVTRSKIKIEISSTCYQIEIFPLTGCMVSSCKISPPTPLYIHFYFLIRISCAMSIFIRLEITKTGKWENSTFMKRPALNKGEVGEISKKISVWAAKWKKAFFLGSEKEEEELEELVYIQLFLYI